MLTSSSFSSSILAASLIASSIFADSKIQFKAAGKDYFATVDDDSLNFYDASHASTSLSCLNFPTKPKLLGTFQRSGLTYLITSLKNNLDFFDLTDPSFPTYITTLQTNDNPDLLKTHQIGSKTFGIITGTDGPSLTILDLSNPSTPFSLSYTQGFDEPGDLAIFSDQDRTYVGVIQNQKLSLYDMTNPTSLIKVRDIALNEGLTSINLKMNESSKLIELLDNQNNVLFNAPLFLSSQLGPFKSNPGVSANILNQIRNNCSQDTQNIINPLLDLDQTAQYKALTGLTPSYKVIQYSLEKLSFAIQKDMQEVLYDKEQHRRLYAIASYDFLKQSGNFNQTGYTTNSAYQFLGVRSGYEKFRWQIGGGASESWMNLHPLQGHANFYTLYATAGLSRNVSRWEFGINGLYGYTFINAKRRVPYISETAKNSHGAYNLNFEGMLTWHYQNGIYKFSPYDTIGYLFGSENNYREHGATGANMKVRSEKIHALRNALGGSIDIFQDRSYQLFVDLAWVYEHYFHNKSYKAAFIGTNTYGTYYQITPTSDYMRVKLGARGHCGKLDWQAMSMTLFGTHFVEETVSLHFTYKY